MIDLWGPEISTVTERSPLSILKEQAALLGEKTKGVVVAEVRTHSSEGEICHEFRVVAPALDYSFVLFSLSGGGAELYPLKVLSNSTEKLKPLGDRRSLRDEAALLSFLKAALSSEKAKRVVSALIAQSS
ncbi:MAG: hypothetical protein NTZ56_13110 [Acidobacteria bacterium]|nr:hypothetical protein [Acidobacteriota bacterium]